MPDQSQTTSSTGSDKSSSAPTTTDPQPRLPQGSKIVITESYHGHIHRGAEGEIDEVLEDGYAVKVNVTLQNLFGGGAYHKEAIVFIPTGSLESLVNKTDVQPDL